MRVHLQHLPPIRQVPEIAQAGGMPMLMITGQKPIRSSKQGRAESYGAHGHRVTSAKGMPARLKQCLDTPGVHVVEVPIDYADNDRILNREVRELSAALPV